MPFPEGPFRIVSFGHVLNELWKRETDRTARRVALIERAATQLASDGQIFVLEPATHAINREMLELRDALAAAGWRIDAVSITECPATPTPTPTATPTPTSTPRPTPTLRQRPTPAPRP